MATSGIGTVLLPTDLAEEFGLVVRFATGLPRVGVTRALVGHVLASDGRKPSMTPEEICEKVESLAAPLSEAGIEVDCRTATGEPTAALVEMARDIGADAVVVGTHGKSVDDRLAVGSVSEALAMSATLPVLLAQFEALSKDDPAAIAARMGQLILVPTDYSASAGRALAFAIAVAKRTTGIVRLVTVLSETNRPTPALEDLRSRVKANGVRTCTVVRTGEPAEEILAEAVACGATSIVMGTRGRSAIGEALLGSISLAVTRDSECPVVIVP